MAHKRKKSVIDFSHVLFSWAPVFIWMSVIFLFSTRQHVSVSEVYVWNFLFFKTLHILEYAVLFFLSIRAISLTVRVLDPLYYFMAFLLTVLYAATDEYHQMFVPTREGTIRDVIIDGIGALIAWISLYTVLPKAPKKLKHLVKRLGFPI